METLFLHIHPEDPQERLIQQAVELIRRGGVIVYPTDGAYALGCHLDDKSSLDRIRQIRQLDAKHNMTLICRDLSEISTYAHVDNTTYRILKAHTPGPYTFVLKASREVPRRLQHPKRKTIGLRVPDNRITQRLLEVLNEPMMNTSLVLPGDQEPLTDPEEIYEKLQNRVDVIIDGGYGELEPTSVIDLSQNPPSIIREGKGDISPFTS